MGCDAAKPLATFYCKYIKRMKMIHFEVYGSGEVSVFIDNELKQA